MQTLLLSLVFSEILDAVFSRATRVTAGRDASKTLWGTTLTRAIAWALAYRLTRSGEHVPAVRSGR